MFNINAFKRRISLNSYKYFICMCLFISGVYISSYSYEASFELSQQDTSLLLNLIIKYALCYLLLKYANYGNLRYVVTPILLVYSGICTGIFLTFILYTCPLYKFILTVPWCMTKITGTIILCSESFGTDIVKAEFWFGLFLCVMGEILLWCVV